jgi:hypothetical protein
MPDKPKVLINLATGLEDPERVTIAFLVAGAALDAGKQVAFFLTKQMGHTRSSPPFSATCSNRRLSGGHPSDDRQHEREEKAARCDIESAS